MKYIDLSSNSIVIYRAISRLPQLLWIATHNCYWLLHLSHIDIGFISQLAYLLKVGMKFVETSLITLHHLGQLPVNFILSALNVEVGIRHPLLFERLTTDSSSLRSPVRHRAHTHEKRLLLGGCIIWKVSNRLLQFVQLCLCV